MSTLELLPVAGRLCWFDVPNAFASGTITKGGAS